MNRSERVNYLSLLSVISAYAVVMVHTNEIFYTFSHERYWFTANIMEQILLFAVPVFFMISGATLIDFYDRYSLKEYFLKRTRKTLIPYIFWSLFGLLFQVCFLHWKSFDNITFLHVINGLLSGNLVDVYWFFIPLFCIYMEIPLFAAVEKKKRNTIYTLIVACHMVFNVVLPFINNVFGLGINSTFSITIGSGYLFYVMLGYLIDRNELDKKTRITIYVLGLLGLLIKIIGTYSMSIKADSIVWTYWGYQNLPCILYSVSIFTLGKYYGNRLLKSQIISNVVVFFSRYTYPLYLIHRLIQWSINQYFQPNTHSIIYRLGCPVPITLVAMLITKLLRKSKVGKYIVP